MGGMTYIVIREGTLIQGLYMEYYISFQNKLVMMIEVLECFLGGIKSTTKLLYKLLYKKFGRSRLCVH